MEYLLLQMLNGVQLGLLMFLLAAGLTLTFGIMDLVNLAHGSLYMMGAYIAWTLIGWTNSFVLGALLALPATFLLGIVVEAIVMRRLYARDHLDQVLATFGLILFFNELVRVIWGPAGKSIAVPSFLNRTVEILPGVPYPAYRFAIIVVGALVAILLAWLVARTRIGMLIRAGASNRRMIGALGVNIELLFTLVFGLGAVFAGPGRPDGRPHHLGEDRHGRRHPDPRLRHHRHRRHRLDQGRVRRRHGGGPDRHRRPRLHARPAEDLPQRLGRLERGAGDLAGPDLHRHGGRAGVAADRPVRAAHVTRPSCSSGPRASGSLKLMSEPEARGPEES